MIPLFKVFSAPGISARLDGVFKSGYIGQGPMVDEFEGRLRERFDSDFVVTTNSCTSALHLALHMIKNDGLSDGDEVLTTPLTCAATNWPIVSNQMKPRWVDIDPSTLNMDLDDLARKITPNTKAVVVVHWGGCPIDLDKLAKTVREAEAMYGNRISVLEDCAHAFGSTYKGSPVGSSGNFCAFSFQAIKHLTCGDGGALITPDQALFRRAKLLRWYGIDRSNNKDFRCESDVPEVGFKFHMNDINATIGLTNLEHVDESVIAKHRDNAAFYRRKLSGVEGVTLLTEEDGYDSSYWIFSILVDRRDDFMQAMKAAGITVSQVHERNDQHSCMDEYRCLLPSLSRTLPRVTAIPVGWWVTQEERQYIVDRIKEGW